MEKTISRQFIIEIRIIITISVVHFPNELNQNRSQYPNWSCDYKLPELSFTLNLLPAFHTICYNLVPLNQLLSLACANSNFWSSPKNSKICLSLSLSLSLSLLSVSLFSLSLSLSLSCVTSIYTWPIRSYLKQTNLNRLFKHCKLVKVKLYKQISIKLCSVIQLVPTIVQFSSYLKYTTFGLLCKQIHSTLSLICTWHVNQCLLSKHWTLLWKVLIPLFPLQN